jgi:hypothetical protein
MLSIKEGTMLPEGINNYGLELRKYSSVQDFEKEQRILTR